MKSKVLKAPPFNLPDQNGEEHTLHEFKGKWLVLYFYPKDDTPGCTKEACNFRDSMHKYSEKNITIIGVSKDSIASHKKFAEKYKLQFLLLSDESREMIKAYGAWGKKKFMGKEFEGTLRNTYLINPTGEIVKTYEKVNPLSHSEEILRDYNSLR